jgi:hypothetical protein
MTDWSAILAHTFEKSVRECGDSGDRRAKALGFIANQLSTLVTTRNKPVVTVVTTASSAGAVTTVTTAS